MDETVKTTSSSFSTTGISKCVERFLINGIFKGPFVRPQTLVTPDVAVSTLQMWAFYRVWFLTSL